jgi:hypothetical protein
MYDVNCFNERLVLIVVPVSYVRATALNAALIFIHIHTYTHISGLIHLSLQMIRFMSL